VHHPLCDVARCGSLRCGSLRCGAQVAVPLQALLGDARAPSTIDYLSLDVEGAEALVLAPSFPFGAGAGQYAFRVLTIERPSAGLIKRLWANQYAFVCTVAAYGELM
jgi:hypothetical protein